jgi:hypothetical protein
VLARIALDSMPLMRRLIIRETVRAGKEGIGLMVLVGKVGASENVVRRAVEDLELHGALVKEKDGSGKGMRVKLSAEMQGEWNWKEWGS